jgi:hypothetical protein
MLRDPHGHGSVDRARQAALVETSR